MLHENEIGEVHYSRQKFVYSLDQGLTWNCHVVGVFKIVLRHLGFVEALRILPDSAVDDMTIWNNLSTPFLRTSFVGWLLKHTNSPFNKSVKTITTLQ